MISFHFLLISRTSLLIIAIELFLQLIFPCLNPLNWHPTRLYLFLLGLQSNYLKVFSFLHSRILNDFKFLSFFVLILWILSFIPLNWWLVFSIHFLNQGIFINFHQPSFSLYCMSGWVSRIHFHFFLPFHSFFIYLISIN